MAKVLTPQQKKNLLRVAEIADNKEIGIVKIISAIEEETDTKIASLKQEVDISIAEVAVQASEAILVAQKTAKMEGKAGYTPKKGVDYNDGENYVLTESDKKDIAQSIRVPVVEKTIIEKHTQTIIKEQPIVKEVQIPIPLHTSPQEVRDLLELLLEDERLDAKAIKGLELAIKAYLILNPPNGPMQHPVSLGNLPDVNIVGAVVDQVLAWNGTYWYPKTSSSSGFKLPTSGMANGSNQIFVWATAPNVIVVDQGRTIQKVSSDGTVNWTGTTTTVLSIAPNFDIYAIA